MKFIVSIVAVDWCGYSVEFENKFDSYEEAEAWADQNEQELADEFSAAFGTSEFEGQHYEWDDLDEEGLPLDENEGTSLTINISSYE